MRDINLLPDDLKKQNSKVKPYLLIAISCLVIMILSYGGIFGLDYISQKENGEVLQEIQEYKEFSQLQQDIEKMKTIVNRKELVLQEIDSKNTNQFLLLQDLELSVPQGIQFIELRTEGGKMTIVGFAKNDRDIADFAAKLHRLEYAKDVWIESTKRLERIQFQLSFNYAQEGGTESEAK